MEYRLAKSVEEIGRELIEEHHPHLHGVRVDYVFVDKTPKSKGRELWGRAKKVSGLNAFLASDTGDEDQYGYAEDFFVVEVAEPAWEVLAEKQRRALVDRTLSCCEIEYDEESGAVTLAVVGPDVAEFSSVIERHGLWTEDLAELGGVISEQLSLLDSRAGASVMREDTGELARVDTETGEVLAATGAGERGR